MSFRISNSTKSVVTQTPIPLPSGQDTQILTNVNGVNSFSYPGYNFNGENMFPGFPNTGSVNPFDVSLTTLTTFIKYLGGSLAPNGNIYFMPHPTNYNFSLHSSIWVPNIGIFNPYTKIFDQTTLSSTRIPDLSGRFFYGSITSHNGKIYGIPANSPFVPIIDPNTNTVDTKTISGLNPARNSFRGGVLAPNGKIYCAPASFVDVSVGVINTNNNTFYTLPVPQPIPGISGIGYYGGALGRNGCVYFAPHRNSGGQPLKIDPLTDTVSHVPDVSLGTCYGAVTGKDGNVYIMPFANGTIPRIDVSGDIVTSAGTRPYNCTGGILGQDGLIYMLQRFTNETRLVALNTDTNTQITMSDAFPSIGTSSDVNPRIGAIMGDDGVLYTVPSTWGGVSSIKTGIPTLQNWMIAPEFNKF
jgi:hypothetical protein